MNLKKIFYAISTIIFILVLSIIFIHPIPLDILSNDLGRHLLLGKIIVASGHVPKVNLLSYTFSDYPFINTHWFSEVIFYLWRNVFGFNGLIILSILLIAAAFFFVFIAAAWKFNLLLTIIISLIYLQVLSERAQVRPELFSFLFLSIFIAILYKYRQKYTKWIFALVPIELLWVNTHIYFFTGIVVLLLFLIDAIISRKDTFSSKKFLTLFFVTLATGLATLGNPNFIKGAAYPLFVLNNYAVPVRENVNFFSSLNYFQNPTFFYFGISVSLLWIFLILSRKKMALIDYLLSAFFTFMALFAIRNFPLFVFGAFVPSVKATSNVVKYVSNKYFGQKTLLFNIMLFTLVCMAVIPSIKWNVGSHGLGFGVIDNAQAAVDFLTNNNLKGPIYNNFDIGNYLEYRLYPKEKVYVDNRPEAYPKEFFQNVYFPMQKSPAIFEQESNKYNFTIIFLAHTDTSSGTKQLLSQLVGNNDWKMVYLNSTIVIFLKNIPSNQPVIKAHLIDQNNVTFSKADLNDKNQVLQLANFFRHIGWEQPQLDMNLRFLDFDPTNCEALKNVANLYQQQNNPVSSVYTAKYLQFCNK